MQRFRKYQLLILLTLFTIAAACRAQNFSTRLYTTADGLSGNYIFSIYQDSYGYLWIGTDNGLSRFDGKQFKTYGLQQGLPSMIVGGVYEDYRHRLWISTRAGIAEMKGDSCYTYPVNDQQQINYTTFMEPDSTKLWAATNKGLYELINNVWVKITLYPAYENAFIGRIIKSKQSLYVNFRNNKVVQLFPGGKSQTLLSVETNKPYYNSMQEVDDKVYIGTYSGLFRHDQDKWVPLFEDTLKKRYVYISYHDRVNRWWFGTKQDGILIAIPDGEKVNFVHIPLSFNLVSQFFEDRNGNMWVAGFQGLMKISPLYYKTMSTPEFDETHFTRNCIVTPSGEVVLSGDNGKLAILKSDEPYQHVTTKTLKDNGDFIDYYTFDDQQRMWFSTRGVRLYRLENTNLKDFTSIVRCKNSGFRGLGYNKRTKQLFVCGDSVLLVGNENYLDTFFSNQKQFIPLPLTIYIKEDGCMLVQSIENGLFLVTDSNKMRPLGKEIDFRHAIVENSGSKNEKIVWAASQAKGVSKYQWKENHAPELIENINEKSGLPNRFILDLAIDRSEKLWIATNSGITLLQKDSHQNWVHRDLEINAPGHTNFFSFTRLSSDAKDNVWTNLDNKFVVFDAQKVNITPAYTNTVIEKIWLFNKPTDWDSLADSVTGYRKLPINPILKYNQNSLSITFNGLQFYDNSQLEYSYRLKPSDTAWSDPAPGNEVSFYQLNPGKYLFEVRSHIKGFDWSKPATFSFTIKRPFWEAWWFRVLVILIATAFIVSIFRYRLMQLKQRTGIQNQLRELETRAFKLQMNPHFIHNALNSIQSLVINNKNNDASRYINKFAKLLRQVLENSEKNIISLDKELSSLQLYVDLEKLRMNMDIDYSVNLGDGTMDASEIKIPPLILQPFVENSLWHGLSHREGDKKILVDIHHRNGWLICEITDNGVGRKKAAEFYEIFPEGHLSKALHIIHQRLIDFNQSPGVEPITFTDIEQNGVAAGTTVVVRIKATSDS